MNTEDKDNAQKRSDIQAQISALLYQANSHYGSGVYVFPTDEQRLEMYTKIAALRRELKSIPFSVDDMDDGMDNAAWVEKCKKTARILWDKLED
jgi:hypothetical protein